MAITTMDGLLAGLQPAFTYNKSALASGFAAGSLISHMRTAGNPGAATLGSPGVNGANVTQATLGGAFPLTNPAGGSLTYLTNANASLGAVLQGLIVFDLLWYNTGLNVTTTTEQTFTTPTLPSRCVPSSGSTPDTAGGGLEAWLYITSQVGASTHSTTTFRYTNTTPTGSRSAGLLYTLPASAATEVIMPFALQAGDTGIKSIEGVTLGTSYTSGSISILIVRRIAEIYLPTASNGQQLDFATLGLPQIYDSSALYCCAMATASGATGATYGSFRYAQG